MAVKKISIKLAGIGAIEWAPNTKEREAAWALYVEYSTRITKVRRSPRGPNFDYGSARLAMTSLYDLMSATRAILRSAGPEIAKTPTSLGPLTIRVLNGSVRLILDKYHTRLEAHESTRKPTTERVALERKWDGYEHFWKEMIRTQNRVAEYARALEKIAGIAPAPEK